MSAAFVVDCSIVMAWLFHDEATPKTAALLNRLAIESALVPTWWFIEITNVLAMAERKGRVTPKQSDAFIADRGKLGIERDDEAVDRAFTHLLAISRQPSQPRRQLIQLAWSFPVLLTYAPSPLQRS
jgi:predicted nucleic acid-binding protein